MIRFLRALLALAWSLWFGGMIALLLFVIRLFHESRETGTIAAPVLFRTFAVYQIALGTICVIVSIAMTAMSKQRFGAGIVTALLMIALAIAFPIWGWTNEMESLRISGQSAGDRFKSLHARSGIAYTTETCALLLAGIAFALSGSAHRARREDSP